MPRKKTTEEFISGAREKHGDKYDYSKVEYDGNKKEVKIICPEHGEFKQSPKSHLRGANCNKCSGTYRYTTKEWVIEATKKHGDKYNYSKVKYVNSKTAVNIICPKHGQFKSIA